MAVLDIDICTRKYPYNVLPVARNIKCSAFFCWIHIPSARYKFCQKPQHHALLISDLNFILRERKRSQVLLLPKAKVDVVMGLYVCA